MMQICSQFPPLVLHMCPKPSTEKRNQSPRQIGSLPFEQLWNGGYLPARGNNDSVRGHGGRQACPNTARTRSSRGELGKQGVHFDSCWSGVSVGDWEDGHDMHCTTAVGHTGQWSSLSNTAVTTVCENYIFFCRQWEMRDYVKLLASVQNRVHLSRHKRFCIVPAKHIGFIDHR